MSLMNLHMAEKTTHGRKTLPYLWAFDDRDCAEGDKGTEQTIDNALHCSLHESVATMLDQKNRL